MTRILIDRADLARFMAARPAILIDGAGIEEGALAGLGLDIWHATRLAEDRVMIGTATNIQQSGGEVEITTAPAGIVAVLASEANQALWRRWFAANLGARGPEFPEEGAFAAMRSIAGRLLADHAAMIESTADLHLALARVRKDHDQIATVASGLVRALASSPAGMMTLQSAPKLGEGAIRLDLAHPLLLQTLGHRVDRIGAVAVALASSPEGGDDHLRVRLSGLESGRIFGSWLVPLAGMAPGWIELELPAPLGWVPETAQLEVHFSAEGEGHVDLAADRLPAFQQNLPRRRGGEKLALPLAVQVWSGDAGSRYVIPDYWDWTELGQAAHPDRIPLAMPLAAYARVRVIQGGMPKPYSPAEIEPMVVGLFGGRQTLVQFPLVGTSGMDVIESVFALRAGDVRNLAVAIWLQPVGHVINSEADMQLAGADVAWSGWHAFGSTGEARVVMELPVSGSGNIQLVVMFDGTSRPTSGLSLLEIRKIMLHAITPGRKARRHAIVVSGKAEQGHLIPRALALKDDAFTAAEASPLFREVLLDEHFDNGNYRHLDIRLVKFTIGECYWPFLKFRVVVEQRNPFLEFRDIPSWPPSLKKWPLATRDNHGRMTRLFGRPAEVAPLRAEAAPEDLLLIKGLVRCLPGVVAKAAELAKLDPEDCGIWADTAADLATKLAAHAALVDTPIQN